MYKFLAKQGQHNIIAQLLTERFGKPHLSLYRGPRGNGVMIVLNCSASNRTVDRFLHSHNVAGSVPRKNKYRIIKGDSWDVIWKFHDLGLSSGDVFIHSINGKLRKATVETYTWCECCGPTSELKYI